MDQNTSLNVSNLEDKESVELFFSCRNLKDMDFIGKSDPLLILYKHIEGKHFSEVGRTEVIKNNLNPDFTKSFRLEFIFETKQKYKVILTDVDNFSTMEGDFLGSAEFELADIIGSLQNMKIMRLRGRKGEETGKCIVRLDKVDESVKKLISLTFGVEGVPKSGFFSSRNSFVKIYKLRLSNKILQEAKSGDIKFDNLQVNAWLLNYKSSSKKGKDINFNQIVMKGSKLCNNNFDIPLKIELWKYKSGGSHKFIGELYISINDIIGRKIFTFKNRKKQDLSTKLIIKNHKVQDQHDFLDFLKGGLNINLSVGIDFTASNKDPEDPKSLHHMNPPNLNLYQQAILSVGEILQKYNHTHQIPCYGFGAKVGNPKRISHFFPINFNPQNPFVDKFDTLFQAYHHCIQNIVFSGPTYFAPILHQINEFTKRRYQSDPYNYSVFLLLTDGIINDLQESIDEIVKGCYLPLSIIIVGLGNENFEKMEILDADDVPLVSSWGETMKRDIVQFVPFVKFKNNPIVLREEVLDEVPVQVEQFFDMVNIKPKDMRIVPTEMLNFHRGNTIGHQQKYGDVFLEENNNNYPRLD